MAKPETSDVRIVIAGVSGERVEGRQTFARDRTVGSIIAAALVNARLQYVGAFRNFRTNQTLILSRKSFVGC
jgi:hypothetical protein